MLMKLSKTAAFVGLKHSWSCQTEWIVSQKRERVVFPPVTSRENLEFTISKTNSSSNDDIEQPSSGASGDILSTGLIHVVNLRLCSPPSSLSFGKGRKYAQNIQRRHATQLWHLSPPAIQTALLVHPTRGENGGLCMQWLPKCPMLGLF